MIILARHGDAVNQDGKFHGITNEPLTLKGKNEVYDLAKQLRKFSPTKIYTSPVRRSKETAQILSSELNAPVETRAELNPLNLGEFVGKPIDKNLQEVRAFLKNPNQTIPGGESVNSWAGKFLPFLKSLPEDDNSILVTHGRNIVLAKASMGHSSGFDKSVLANNDKSTEHGGFAIIDGDKFSIETPRAVKRGQS